MSSCNYGPISSICVSKLNITGRVSLLSFSPIILEVIKNDPHSFTYDSDLGLGLIYNYS